MTKRAAPKPVDPVLAAEMREFSRRQNFPHVEVRRMTGSRYQDIGYKRGKECSRMYILPALDKGEHVPPGFHTDTPTTHDPAGEPHARG